MTRWPSQSESGATAAAAARRAWQNIWLSGWPASWNLDLETSNALDLTAPLVRLAESLDLDFRWLAPYQPPDCLDKSRTFVLRGRDSEGSHWLSVDGKGAMHGFNFADERAGSYLEAVNDLSVTRSAICLAPEMSRPHPGASVATNGSLFFMMSRPFILARDAMAPLPRPHPRQIGLVPTAAKRAGWSDRARARAARVSIAPLDRCLDQIPLRRPGHSQDDLWGPPLRAAAARFRQLLQSRDEIEWSVCMMPAAVSFTCYRFDHLVLLATAFLDQLAYLLLLLNRTDIRDKNPSAVSMSPGRGRRPDRERYPKEVGQAIAVLPECLRSDFQSVRFLVFREFLYGYRNHPAHRRPTSATVIVTSPEFPEADLVELPSENLFAAAKELHSGAENRRFGGIRAVGKVPHVDPLGCAWHIVAELHSIALSFFSHLQQHLFTNEVFAPAPGIPAQDDDELVWCAIPVFLP